MGMAPQLRLMDMAAIATVTVHPASAMVLEDIAVINKHDAVVCSKHPA